MRANKERKGIVTYISPPIINNGIEYRDVSLQTSSYTCYSTNYHLIEDLKIEDIVKIYYSETVNLDSRGACHNNNTIIDLKIIKE